MKRLSNIVFCLSILFISCDYDKNNKIEGPKINNTFNDSSFVKNTSFPKGDLRRYGIYPDTKINSKTLEGIFEMAQNGTTIHFPKGSYSTNVIIKGLSDLTLSFDDATICGALYILDSAEKQSNRIEIKGSLTILDKLFIRKSRNIIFNKVKVKTDTINNLLNKKNRGVSIYVGSKNILIKNLEIYNTGGTKDEHYKFSAAALQIHGWNNNPENINIEHLLIKDADRSAVYLTGNNQTIKKANIVEYGLGSAKNMFGLDDAKPGTEKQFSGFWINKCNDCVIDSLQISNISKKVFSLKFGLGAYSKPTFINNLSLREEAKRAPIESDLLTNVLVKNEY